MWKALDDMDDDLLGDKKAQEALEREMEMMSDGDRIMTTWVDDLYKAKESISNTCIGDEAARRHAASLLLMFQEGASEGPTSKTDDVSNDSTSSVNDRSGSTLIGEADKSNISDTDDDDDDDDEDEDEDEDDDDDEDEESGETITPLRVEMDFQQVGASADDEQQPDADNAELPVDTELRTRSQKEIYQEVDIVVNVANKRGKSTIRSAKLNPLAFIDIVTVGWKKLSDLDLVNTRFAAKEREKRKQNIREEVYDQVKGNIGGTDTDNTMEAMGRLDLND